MKHHILYIPGVGDSRVKGQRLLMRIYQLYGVEAEVFQVYWAVDEPYVTKQQRILARIDELRQQGKTVSLMGFSAGGSAALNTFKAAPDKVNAVVTVSGIVKGSVNPRYYTKNPAFRDSIASIIANIPRFTRVEKSKILIVGSYADPIVPLKLAAIPGVKTKALPSVGHAGTLVYATLFAGRYVTKFIKRQS